MNDIYVLNQAFNIIGVIDDYVSAIWRPAYNAVGDFEIYLNASKKAVELLQRNNYVVRRSDASVDSSGNVTYKKVMQVKNINLTTDAENGDFLTVTGRELKYILHQRIVWEQTNLTGNAEAAIRRLVNENAINPTNKNRVIPDLILDNSAGLAGTIDKQITGEKLDVAIKEICVAFNYGWDVYIKHNKLVFCLYKGVDRSYNQSGRPYVVFSENFDNLQNTEYAFNSEGYANTALVGGEGEGTARAKITLNDNFAGLERYEIFTDARDISQNKDSEDAISDSEYFNLLAQRGVEDLKELNVIEAFTGEVLSDITFKYGTDFYLGDTVTVINKYGISQTAQVFSAIESEDENGTKLIPQFTNENNEGATSSGGSSGSTPIDNTVYKPGDVVTFTGVYASGFVTSSAKRISVLLPLSKPCTATKVTLSNFTAELRGIAGYLNSTSGYVDIAANYTVAAGIMPNGIRIYLTYPQAIGNTTNNTPAVINANVTVTFS